MRSMHGNDGQNTDGPRGSLAWVPLLAVIVGATMAATPLSTADAQSRQDVPQETATEQAIQDFHEEFTPPVLGELHQAEVVTVDGNQKALLLSTENQSASSFATKLVVDEDAAEARLVVPVSGTVYAADTATIRVEGSNGTLQEHVIGELESPQFKTVEMNLDAFRSEDPVLVTLSLEGPSGSSRLFVETITLEHEGREAIAASSASGGPLGDEPYLSLAALGVGLLALVGVFRVTRRDHPDNPTEEVVDEVRQLRSDVHSGLENVQAKAETFGEEMDRLQDDYESAIEEARETTRDTVTLLEDVNAWVEAGTPSDWRTSADEESTNDNGEEVLP
jgi:hypothetical protein